MKNRLVRLGLLLVMGLIFAACPNDTDGGGSDSGGGGYDTGGGGYDTGGNGGGGGSSKATIIVINTATTSMITMCDVVSFGIQVTSLASSGSPIGTNEQRSCQVDPGDYGVQIKTNTGQVNGSGTFSLSAGETKTLTWKGTSF
jgi:hypothetical protein